MALISILDNCTIPVSGADESCIISTEPLLTWVVTADHKADDASPKRTSLPSMAESNVEVDERLSDQIALVAEMIDISSIEAKTKPANLARLVKKPSIKITETGISKIASISRKFDNGVGFSKGTLLFGPYQPPPLLPNCLIATMGATGPKGIFCVVNSLLWSMT